MERPRARQRAALGPCRAIVVRCYARPVQQAVLALLLCTLGCASTNPNEAEPTPAPTKPEAKPMAETPEPLDLVAMDEAARTCDGASLYAALEQAGPDGLRRLEAAEAAASLRLFAAFERRRAFASDGAIDASGVRAFADVAADVLGFTPPAWWVEQLAAGKRSGPPHGDGSVHYDVGRTSEGDRRGALVEGPGGTRVRKDQALWLARSGDELAIDLSMQRVSLGPLPPANSTVEATRFRGGTTVFVASFDAAAGGMRFPLRAWGMDALLWQTEACGPGRTILGGLGYATVELVVDPAVPDRVFVFSAESHGVALEAFATADGRRTLAWSSNFWFQRPLAR